MAVYVAPPPDLAEIIGRLDADRIARLIRIREATDGRVGYVPWDKLRHLDPPEDLTHEEWWWLIKLGRGGILRPWPLTDPEGHHFEYAVPDEVFRLLHFVDQGCSGAIAMPTVVTADEQARQHYLVNSLMEEAIRSSQLEGATTSRTVAKDLLRSGRPPADRSERMILNNYMALLYMREIGKRITPANILELQRILTVGTLENPDGAGRLQTPDEERVAVFDRNTGELIHSPPPAEQLPARIEALCAFANQDDEAEPFVHPVIKAILLHFWLAYDHPFEDGNGRTARALFYWYMRTHDYWLVEYLSISRILRKAPRKYVQSFVLTETDGGDATYFLIYQLEVIKRAIEELHEYLQKKISEIRTIEELIRGYEHFNHRQLALLSHAIRHETPRYTFQSHATSHGVTIETARTDLLDLMDRGLLDRRRSGRRHVFVPVPHLKDRIVELGRTPAGVPV